MDDDWGYPHFRKLQMLVISWTYATIRITLGVQNMYQYVRDPVTKSTCSLRYVYVYGHLLVHIWGYRRVSNIEHCPPCGCSARHFRCRAGVSAWYYWLMHDNTGYVSLYIICAITICSCLYLYIYNIIIYIYIHIHVYILYTCANVTFSEYQWHSRPMVAIHWWLGIARGYGSRSQGRNWSLRLPRAAWVLKAWNAAQVLDSVGTSVGSRCLWSFSLCT